MARTKSFKFRINSAERRMITWLASMESRSESDLIRRLIAEAASTNSITWLEDDEKLIERSSLSKQESKEVET